jgi:hypothetical protein
MLTFKDFEAIISEDTKPSTKEIHYSDLDGVLVHHDDSKLRVHVNNHNGERVHSLTNQEFNTHALPKDHNYDFSEFKSSDVFGQSAKPIKQVISKMKTLQKNGHKVEILTARADMDDQKKFAHHMKKFGIDIDKMHVRRSGNLSSKPAEGKKQIMTDAITKHGYKKVHLYDDSKENLDAMISLKKKFPEVEFHAHHVKHDPKTGKTEIKTRKV